MPTLRQLIDGGGAHVMDGAMGTLLHHKGAPAGACFDELARRQPELVASAHAAYIAAGAQAIETNSFGANPVKLASYGLAEETELLNRAAVEVAREAAGTTVCVLGAIGPLGVRVEPFGELSLTDVAAAFSRQVRGLLDGGVDGFILETFSDLHELEAAIAAVRSMSDLALMAQMTVDGSGLTAFGTSPEIFGPALVAAGADVVGVNCSTGPVEVLGVVERLATVVKSPISAQPNAGLPRDLGDRKLYVASPEYVGQFARRMVEAGARFVGGCCGTTPEHIAMVARFVKSATPATPTAMRSSKGREEVAQIEPVPLEQRSHLGAKLAKGEWLVSVEVVPPRGADAEPILASARALKLAGVDAVNIPDGPRAQSRMSALMASLLIERETGLEAIPHYACRDRNLLGMLSDLLGAGAAGLRNLLIVTGDPPKMGPYPDATAVFDIDAIGLTNLVARLNRGLDPGGNSLGNPTAFVHGVGVNPAAPDLDRELRRFHWKAEAGACFAMTQPVFDMSQLESGIKLLEGFGVPIIVGVWPLLSLRNAEFLANEVPGVSVPDWVLERMRLATRKGKAAALDAGVQMASDMVASLHGRVAGVQVAAPMGKVEVALRVAGLSSQLDSEPGQ